MSTAQESLQSETTLRKQHLQSLKDRLAKYKAKSELISEKEKQEELALIEKENLQKQEKERLEAEKNSLVQELQRMANAEVAPAEPLLQTALDLQQQLQEQLRQKQQPPPPQPQPQSMQMFSAFGYTEKEAIDWLRNGL